MKVSIKQYSQTLFDLTDGKSEQEILSLVKNFAAVLKKEGQLKNAPKIMEKFGELFNSANGIVETEVISKEKLSSELVEKLNIFIKDKYKSNEVIVKNIIDEKIKGGIVIRVGDEVMDASVAGQLRKLKDILSE